MNTKIDEKMIKKFIERRKLDGMANSTINTEVNVLNKFNNWCRDNLIKYFNSEDIKTYLNNLKCGKQLFRKEQCTLFRLYEFLTTNEYKIITTHKEKILINKKYEIYFNTYINEIRNKFDKTTINNKKVFLKYFFQYVYENKITELSELKQSDITKFLNSCITKYSKAYFNKIAYFVREYLNYLYDNNIINFKGSLIIPKLNTCCGTKIPTTYSNDEIKEIILSVDKSSKIGKRDYLILLLLSIYGIRIGDICNIKINNFDLEHNKLSFIQKKTAKFLELPLIDEVKYAFIDYLKNSRPKHNSEYLFITYTKPNRNYDKKGLRNVVPKYLKLAHINTSNKKKGAHALRHSLASNMLLNGSNIKQISDILGHNYISTTNQYLTIDINKLQELCLELPKNCIEEVDLNERL